MTRWSDLSALINPKSIVLVGASDRPGSMGQKTLANLAEFSAYDGALYLVNSFREMIGKHRCYSSVAELPEAPDVAVLVVPAKGVPGTLRECAEKGVRFAVVFSSGFGETGESGKQIERDMVRHAREYGMRVYGPNVPGLTNINRRLGMSFSPSFRLDQRSGPIGLVTQGGGLGRTFMQAMDRGVGVGIWASTGNESDLSVSDFIRYMAESDDIKVIATVIEGVKDGSMFAEAALLAARHGKPIVAMKVGRSEYGVKAAQSHTASLAGSAEVNSAVFRQLGIIEVDEIDELIDTAALLVRATPKGDEQLAIFTYSGGAATLAADAVGFCGLTLAELQQKTKARLREFLPDFAAFDNPVDTTAEILTNPSVGAAALQAIVAGPQVGAVLFPFPVEYGAITTAVAEGAVQVQKMTEVPILPVWMSDRQGEGYGRLADGGLIPNRSLLKAVRSLQRWIEFGRWRRDFDPAWNALVSVSDSPKRMAHTEAQAKSLLQAQGIPVPASGMARSADEAAHIAERIGFPVVAKIVSTDIVHKSYIGGVKVGLTDAASVCAAFDSVMQAADRHCPSASLTGVLIEAMAGSDGVEVVIGVSRDRVFGHILSFGLGGVNIELFKDVSRRLLPLTVVQARAMVEETRCFKLLDGYRGRPKADVDALCAALIAVSAFVVKHADLIEEIEINPLWVGPQGEGVLALDAVLIAQQELTL